MFFSGKSKQLPFFSQYLQHRAQDLKESVSWINVTVIPILFGLFLFIFSLFAMRVRLSFVEIVTAIIMVSVVLSLFNRRKPKVAEETRRVLQKFLSSLNRRSLHRELDPTAAQLAESCAYYWQRIRTVFDGPYWSSKELSAHYQTIRSQALMAAEQAMEEAMLTSVVCLGAPDNDRRDDFSNALEELSSLNLDSFAQQLGKIASADPGRYVHHSPHARAIYEPLHSIATRLKDLSAEIEKLGAEMLRARRAEGPASLAISSLDLVLGELRTTARAEQELADDKHLQQGLD